MDTSTSHTGLVAYLSWVDPVTTQRCYFEVYNTDAEAKAGARRKPTDDWTVSQGCLFHPSVPPASIERFNAQRV